MLTQVDRLDALIRHWLDLSPALAYKKGHNRAESAACFVGWHNWRKLDDPIYTHVVNGHRCGWKNQVCDCLDLAAPVHPDHGRLCKHRLAVWMIEHLAAEEYQYFEQLIIRVAQNTIPELVLTVRTTYTHGSTRNNTQINQLLDWRAAGHTRELAEQRVTFSISTLQFILYENRYCVAPARRVIVDRHLAGRERWFLIPMPADAPADPFLATNVGMLFGIDVALSEERAQRQRLSQLFNQEANSTHLHNTLPVAA